MTVCCCCCLRCCCVFAEQDQNRDHFVGFLSGEEDFTQYVLRKREPHCYGNHIEIQAMSEIYNRSVEVYRYDPCKPMLRVF